MCDMRKRGKERERDARGCIPMAGERRMGSRWRGEKKGVKNVGAEETGGKNRAVSTEAARVRSEGQEEDRMERREEKGSEGKGREGLEERSRLEEMGERGRRMADEHKGEEKSGDGERRKIESARKTKR